MKSNWKKLSLTIGLGTALILTGCSSDSSANEDVTLTYSIWDQGQAEGMNAIADAFEEENPTIQVNVEVTPWDQYWTKLESGAQGESLPDLFWMHSNEFANYSEGQILMDVTDLADESETLNMADFPEELVELYTTENDELLGVPKDYGNIGLWYNKTLFDEAGLDYPDEDWTWDDLLENAEILTDVENDVYGVLAPLNREEGYHNFIHQNGGYVISEDKTTSGFREDETVEAVQWYADLSVEHGVSPTVGQFADNSNLSFFQSGRAAMGFFGSWMISQLAENEYTNENVDVAPMPAGTEEAVIYNGLANSISAFTDYPEEARQFLEFLSSEEAMIIQGEYGSAIPALSGTDTSFLEAYPQFNIQAYLDQMEYAVIKPYSKYTARWEDVENQALIPVFEGEATVEEVSETIITGVEEVLESEN
ncbi:multiple sugar transport system substrate-binding protein [Alkalibacterium subtropicum]|uniref:Multiple sugar transport system substrate-binding protein n=1 Tax=Alkalibacterium subtropicum TaxID=753702 RepID=A0A1I1GHM6_9LACT|nr:sugar ABC transporter substrate-binding protein [Alkalibacterium subtropicum]SFC09358.1 multiple sugar transport system substrate-binding protein [Alkalibacterium subtropicum]